MGSLVFLIAGAWMAAQSEPAEPNLVRLQPQQEFVYSGPCTLIVEQPGNRTSRTWYMMHCILIRNTSPHGADATFLTIQKTPPQPGITTLPVAQLEQAVIESNGRIVFQQTANSIPRIPLDGPPNLEVAAFIEMPKSGLNGPTTWTTKAENGLPQTWRVQGVEAFSGSRYPVLIGEQASPDWKNGSSPGWWRQDRVLFDLSAGYAVKIERTIRRREEGNRVSTLFTSCELDAGVPSPCPGGLFQDRWDTIKRTVAFVNELAGLQLPRGAPNLGAYNDLLTRIDQQLRIQADTPYREAMVTLRRRVEQARQGERPPEPLVVPTMKVPLPAFPTEPTGPDLALTDLVSGRQGKLSALRGKPVILFFFKPSSSTVQNVLDCAQDLSGHFAGQAHVLAVAAEGAPATILALRNQLQLTIGVFTGQDARRLLSVESTPCTIILDKSGAIRFTTSGWGGEYPVWIGRELENVLHPSP
jgi:hypothetical protein